MKINRLTAAVLFSLVAFVAMADATRTVTGEFTYYGDENCTLKDARTKAIEGARINALAKAFGTTVSQSVISDESSRGGVENTFFASLSETEVKGEWINDIGEPELKISLDNDGMPIVWCRIKGLARELSNKAVEYEALVLRNGSDKRNADTHFRSGDDMRLYFKAPVDGYIAVYLAGEDRMVYTLLPYLSNEKGLVKVRHGREYVFFDQKLADPDHGIADEMCLVSNADIERDRIIILFSPNAFIKANDAYVDEKTPRSIPFNEFHKWLSKIRKNDPSLGYKQIDIIINGQN